MPLHFSRNSATTCAQYFRSWKFCHFEDGKILKGIERLSRTSEMSRPDAAENRMRLKNRDIRSFEFTIQQGQRFRAIIVSDLHIGQHKNRAESTRAVVANIRQIVASEGATHVFILGDMIHLRATNLPRHWSNLFRELESVGIEVHTIPGNHDRFWHKVACKSYRGVNVHPHQCHVIVVRQEAGGPSAVLGHHLNNDMKVHMECEVREWYRALRSTFSDIIDEDALLVLGHLHQVTDSVDQKTRSVLMFSNDLFVWAYSVLEREDDRDGGMFVLTRKTFSPTD